MKSCLERNSIGSMFDRLESRTLFSTLTPAQVRHAYGFDLLSRNGAGQTIAIVDAYADPRITSDLQTFDQRYGISNTDGSGRFALTVATPQGAPAADAGWSEEIALDVEWAHAIAPAAHILLVEARSSSLSNLLSAVDYARRQAGVSVVSMSWGSSEFFGEWNYDGYFTTPAGHQGVTFVASSGDSGTTSWPATSPNVLAVGGTTLNVSSNGTYIGETAWSGSGGGVSFLEQTYGPDVAYDADPNTGFAVYDSVPYSGQVGWQTIGGTSAGAPQWAGLIAIADQSRAAVGRGTLSGAATLNAIYSAPSTDFHDITSGHNAFYMATSGYDLVTGRGSPKANLLVGYLTGYGSASANTTATTAAASTQQMAPSTSFGSAFSDTPIGAERTWLDGPSSARSGLRTARLASEGW
jgi:subtilase family serine protease